jgi:hypothetical protein
MDRAWRYLALAVEVSGGKLAWIWIANMKGPAIAEAARHWQGEGIGAVVWDGASGRRAPEVAALGVTAVRQPPYAPELNPAERVFEEPRAKVEGKLYPTRADQVAAVERELAALAFDPDRVKRLVGCHWIRQASERLPQAVASS